MDKKIVCGIACSLLIIVIATTGCVGSPVGDSGDVMTISQQAIQNVTVGQNTLNGENGYQNNDSAREQIMIDFKQEAAEFFDKVVAIRRYLHQYPEIGGEEELSTRRIAEELDKIGIHPTLLMSPKM